MKNAKKLHLFVLAHGRLPGSRMAHKVYHWVDPEGRPTSPPPDPFEIQDNSKSGEYKLLNEADERKVGLCSEQLHYILAVLINLLIIIFNWSVILLSL